MVKSQGAGRYTLAMDDSARFDMELNILRLMLARAEADMQPNAPGGDLTAFVDQLSDYKWTDSEHRVVYECLRAVPQVRIDQLREEVASIATRLGHPDVNWGSYLGQPTKDIELVDLIERLKRNSL